MTSPFHAGGPLAAEDSLVYVERQGDVDALSWLTSPQQAADLLVVAPRQQGKTSCLYKLMRHPGLINYKFVYADLQNCNCVTEAEWYSDLWQELKASYADLRNLADIPVPTNARDWEDRMRRLAEAAFQTSTRLVIVLDEIDVMRRARTEHWSSRFFSTLRKLENARPINPALRSLYFVFIGAFHPRDLVHDDSVSPFNIAQRVVLPDFTATQVQSLVKIGGWAEAQVLELADRIFYWTDGQPYLTQAICKTLRSGARSNDVDKAVAVFRQSDLIHLPPIIKRLKADPSLMEYIRRIQADHRVPFSQQDPESAESKLELLGVIKADSEGCCKVRNRLYREVLGLEKQKQRPATLSQNALAHDPGSGSRQRGLEGCSADKDRPALKQSLTGVCGADALAPQQPSSAAVPTSLPDLQLLITLAPDSKTLSYTLNSPDGDYNFLPVGEVSLAVPPRELLQRTFDRLSALARLTPDARTPAQTAQCIRDLADVGTNLYDELFPPEFKREYSALRKKHLGGNLLITTNDPWIPWEIVRPLEYDRRGKVLYDDSPLCESFQLARWFAGAAAPKKFALGSAVVIQPQANLLAARGEREYFAALPAVVPGLVVAASLQTVSEVLASFSVGQTRLYHFVCHGNFDLTDPNDSKLKLADGFLTPSQIAGDRRSGLLRAQPLVFVNACHAGERGFGLTRLGGWAERFISAGASAFIGSLWEINDVLAARFAAEFYNRLFGLGDQVRLPVAAAFREARLVLKELDPANPTWLAYVLYGNPRAQVSG